MSSRATCGVFDDKWILGTCLSVGHGSQSFIIRTKSKKSSLNVDRRYITKKLRINKNKEKEFSDIEMKYKILKNSKISLLSIMDIYGVRHKNGNTINIIMERLSHTLNTGYIIKSGINTLYDFYFQSGIIDIYNNKIIISFIKDISSQIIKLHSLNYVHGDLKPDNIMFNKKIQKWVIIDYDMMIKLNDINNNAKIHGFFGSIGWQSPEVIPDDNITYYINKKLDVFTFGLILLYIFYGGINKYKISNEFNIKSNKKKKKYKLWYNHQLLNNGNKNDGQQLINQQINKLFHGDSKLLLSYKILLIKMLKFNPNERISIQQVFEYVSLINIDMV